MHQRSRTVRLLAPALALAGAAAGLSVVAGPAAAETLVVSPTGTVTASVRGNGHGHGMSQYGARGAALAGRSYQQILAFYYPGTTLSTLPGTGIRVQLSGYGSTTTVGASTKLTVTGVSGVLPSAGVARYRLVASGAGLALQRLLAKAGSGWLTYRTGLPNRAEFHNVGGIALRLFTTSGASTYYSGSLRAVRTSTGVYTVDRTTLDSYTAGVVPRESPAYWPVQSLYAQAVAARSYARYEVEHAPPGSEYDICATSSCQVYGGHLHLDNHGAFVWQDFPTAAVNTAGKVLRYRGATIFAQFSASNGGWSTSGGQPYLVAKVDAYDSARSADPYLLYTQTVGVAALGRYFGIARLEQIVITKRDGHGAWGGRVVSGYVVGRDARNAVVRVNVTGADLQYALGVGSTWLSLRTG